MSSLTLTNDVKPSAPATGKLAVYAENNTIKILLADGTVQNISTGQGVDVTDLGGIPDGLTDVGPAFAFAMADAHTNAIASGAQRGLVRLRPGVFKLNSVLDMAYPMVVEGEGAVLKIGATQLVRALTSQVIWRNTTFFYDSSSDNTNVVLFRTKASGVDTILNNTDWTFQNCIFDGVSVRHTRINRTSTPVAIGRTSLRLAIVNGQSALDVGNASLLTGYSYARIGVVVDVGNANYGSYIYKAISSLDLTTNIVNLGATVTGTVNAGSYVAGATRTEGAALTLANTIKVENITGYAVGNYAQFYVSQSVTFQSLITAIDSVNRLLTLGTPLTVDVPNATYCSPMNAAIITTGSDFAGNITHLNCRHENVRSQYAVELGGIDQATLIGSRWKNVFAYRTAGVSASGYNPSFGECLKITAGTTGVQLDDLRFENYARDGIDLFDAGEVTGTNLWFKNSYIGSAVESKRNIVDTNVPKPIILTGLRIENMASNGLTLGVDDITISDVHIKTVGSVGIYLNGGRPDNLDTLATKSVNLSNAIIDGAGTYGLYCAEIDGANITNLRAKNSGVYGAYLGAYATNLNLTNIDVRNNTSRGIRIEGAFGITTGHNITNLVRSDIGIIWGSNVTGVAINGYGEETGLLAGATPTAIYWRVGHTVRNMTDNLMWRYHLNDGWIRTGTSEVIYDTALTWNSLVGSSGQLLTVANGAYSVDTTALGVPGAAKSVIVEVAGRWTTASNSNSCTVANGTSGSRAATFRSQAANIASGVQCKVGLVNGVFRITIAGADMDFSYVKIVGYVI